MRNLVHLKLLHRGQKQVFSTSILTYHSVLDLIIVQKVPLLLLTTLGEGYYLSTWPCVWSYDFLWLLGY